jgi:tetratricopeptide (TPR) repeat protein
MLGSKLYQAGDLPGSAVSFTSVLKQQPEHFQALLLLARTQARAGHSEAALKLFARAQQVDPSNAQAWQVAAALAADTRDWLELLRIGHGWTRAHPDSLKAWQALSRAHFEESRFKDAIAAHEPVLELEPDNASHLISAARLASAAQDYEIARAHLSAAQNLTPDSGELLYALSRLHYLTGELSVAENYCRRAIASRPGFAPAYVVLGALREGRLEEGEMQLIDQLFNDEATHPEYRAMLGFTLGEALDRNNDFDRAFNAWDAANNINRLVSEREGFIYQPEQVESELELLTKLFAGTIELQLTPQPSSSKRPIFVVGMPRTGTTLLESILASHSLVYGAGELPTLYDIHESLMEVARCDGVEAACDMLIAEANNWRDRYLAALPLTHGATCVVDKQPLNFRSVGLIRLLFPDAPIIYAKRAPMDVGFSIYRHKFSKNWPCASRLSDIGHYYGVHARIISLWEKLYSDFVHVVEYASLVNNLDAETRRLLAFAKLDFEPACLAHHKNKRAVATFSAVQVQHPVSIAYSNRSARYAAQLAPLRDAMIQAGIDIAV